MVDWDRDSNRDDTQIGAGAALAGVPRRSSRIAIQRLRTAAAGTAWLVRGAFGLASLAVGLAMLAAMPVVQFFALGYLLDAAGQTARSGRIRDALRGLGPAARLGGLALALWLWSLPLRLLVDWRKDALVIDPAARSTRVLTVLVAGALILFGFQAIVAVARGGRFRDFFRPVANLHWLWQAIAHPRRSDGRSWRLAVERAAKKFWRCWTLGIGAFVVGFAWLALPSACLAAGRQRPIIGLVGAIVMALVLLYVPFAQIRFVTEGRWLAAFEVGALRARFRKAPLAFALALLTTVLLALPLYSLKIERLPADVVWLPSVLFIVTMAPVKVTWAWAYARGGRDRKPSSRLLTWPCRLAMLVAAGVYVLVVFFTQYTGWDGAVGIFEHHAFLLPVPF